MVDVLFLVIYVLKKQSVIIQRDIWAGLANSLLDGLLTVVLGLCSIYFTLLGKKLKRKKSLKETKCTLIISKLMNVLVISLLELEDVLPLGK